MQPADFFGAVEVGERAGNAQHAVIDVPAVIDVDSIKGVGHG